jgi:hypothetical protein
MVALREQKPSRPAHEIGVRIDLAFPVCCTATFFAIEGRQLADFTWL